MCELCDKENNMLMTPSRTIDMANLPPCRKSLEQHIRWANYQTALWNRGHIPDPDVPAPDDDQWWTPIGGKLEPLWFLGDILPENLADIMVVDHQSDNDDDEGSEFDVEFLPTGTNYLLSESSVILSEG